MNLYILLMIEYITTINCLIHYGYTYDRNVLNLLNYNPVLYLGFIISGMIIFYLNKNYTQNFNNKYIKKGIVGLKLYLVVIIIINITMVINI